MKNMTNLRSKLIRLAHEKPELRSRLLPILAKTAAKVWKAKKITDQMVAEKAQLYWSPRQQAFDPTMMGNSSAKTMLPQLVRGFEFDLASAFYFSPWNKAQASEIEEGIIGSGHPNAKNLGRNLAMSVFNSHSGSSQPSFYWDVKYSGRLQDLKAYVPQLKEIGMEDIATKVQTYVGNVETIRKETEKMIEASVQSGLKKLGMDPALVGEADKFAAKDEVTHWIVTTYKDSTGKEKTSKDSWLPRWGKPTKANFEKIVSKGVEDKSLGTPVEMKLIHRNETLFTYKPKTASVEKEADKLFRFPQGTMTEKEWVQQHAVRLEEAKVDWHSLMNKKKWNGLEGRAQDDYEAELKEKAKKPVYRAWNSDSTFQTISKSTYEWAKREGIGKTASEDKEAMRGRFTMPRSSYIPKDEPTLQQRKNTPEGLEVWTWEGYSRGQDRVVPYAIAFAGKADKPLWHHSFRDINGQEKMIQETIKDYQARVDAKRQRMEEKKNFQHGIQVGDIFVASWGYDQTQTNWFQVVALYGKAVGIREIAAKTVREELGSVFVVGIPNKFIGPEKKKIPQSYRGNSGLYIKINDTYSAYKWDGKPMRETASGYGH